VNAPSCDAEPVKGSMVPDLLLPPLRILVVEDEGLIALNLELILQRFGCDVIGPISEVDKVIDAVTTHRPDGAFLDVNLRGRRVFEVLPELIGLGIPCVLSSGYDDPMLFPSAFRDMPRIAKPFDETALRRACVEFGSLAEARQSIQGGENQAVAFPRRRRFSVPTQPIGREEEPPGRAVAGLRGR
jgi:DNA-binding LytR/AlgR family response regulator